MKKICYLLIIIVAAGCSQPKPKGESDSPISREALKNEVKAEDTLKTIIDANINKQPAIDTVALGFSFNMTKKQVIAHYNDLVKQKKLVFNKKNNMYEYPMSFQLVNTLAVIAPQFHDDKLFKLSLIIEPADEVVTNETVYLQAAILYMKKYRS
ncbi:MAG: hypothetical protein ACXVAY_00850 [Mucilaginibacter sp.]